MPAATTPTPELPPTISTSRHFARILPPNPIVRRLSVAMLVNTFGNGLFYTISALYFTRIVGIPVAQVGLGLTIAGALGVAAGVPFGQLADRVNVRTLIIAVMLLEAAAMTAYTLVHSFIGFLLVASAATVTDRGASAVRAAMLAIVLPPETRTETRGYLRAVTNVGIGTGSAFAAIALAADSREAYVAMILLDAATFMVGALILVRLPVRPHEGKTKDHIGKNPALRDGPYLAITALTAVISMNFGLLEIGVPLWIVDHTQAPRVLVALTLILNTVLVVLFQVRATRGMTTIRNASRAARRSGLILAAACVGYAFASGTPAWIAAVVVVAATVVETTGEIISSAAGWALSYDLAAPEAPGAYQGVFTSGFALAGMLAPLVVTSTALHLGRPGWVLLGGVFALAGAALVPVSAWAARAGHRALPL